MAGLYDDAPLAIRDDLALAHRETVEAWARPGNHWSAAERLAIVGEVRRARAAEALPAWVAPSTVDGLVDGLADGRHPLPAVAVDAVWRLTNHPGTLTREWYDGIVARGLDPEPTSSWCRSWPRPVAWRCSPRRSVCRLDPCPGRPRASPTGRCRPRQPSRPTGCRPAPGRGPNVGRALTAVPVAVAAWRRLSPVQYMPPEALRGDLQWSRGALDRRQVELLAARTSLLNECFY